MSDASTSLFVMLRGVLFDESEQSAYLADPSGYLAAHGYDELDHDDVSEAMTLLADSLPADQAALLTSSGDAAGFGATATAPAPPSDLAPVDQAVHTINHFVDTVREAPDAGLGGTDPGPGDLAALDDAGAAGGLAHDPSAAFDDLGAGFDDLDAGDVAGDVDGLGAFDDLDTAPPADGVGDLDDQLAAFAAPDVLVHGDPVDALLEDGDLAVAFEASAVADPGAFDPGAFDSDEGPASGAPAFDTDLDADLGDEAGDGIDDLDEGV
jgi:hypothetical protein